MGTTLPFIKTSVFSHGFSATLAVAVFLLPLQTRWIMEEGLLWGQHWEPLTRSVYAVEVFLWAVIGLSFMRYRDRLFCRGFLPLLFLAIAFLSVVWAERLDIAEVAVARLAVAVIFFLMLQRDPKNLRIIAWAWIAAGLMQSILAIAETALQYVPASTLLGMAAQDPSVSGVSVVAGWGGRFLRAYGTFPHPNILGGFLVLSIFLVFWLAQFSLTRKERVILSVAAILLPWATVLTFSRAALLASAVIIACVLLAIATDAPKKLKNLQGVTLKYSWFVSIVIVTLMTAAFVYASPLLGRVDNNFYSQYSQSQRVENREQAESLVPSSWLHGVGIASEPIAVANVLKPSTPPEPLHNVFGLIGLELGIFGLLLFVVLVFHLLRPHLSALFSSASSKHLLAFVPIGGWLAIMILLFFDHYLWTSFSGLLMLWTVFAFLRSDL